MWIQECSCTELITKYDTNQVEENKPGQKAKKANTWQAPGELIQMEWAKATFTINNPRVKTPKYPVQNNV